jgi:uncharacterized protein YihD (DUF1040 family)
MRDPRRIERILALIKEIWVHNPDQRLGQLLGNYAMPEARQGPMWHIEDDQVEGHLRSVVEEAAARRADG